MGVEVGWRLGVWGGVRMEEVVGACFISVLMSCGERKIRDQCPIIFADSRVKQI